MTAKITLEFDDQTSPGFQKLAKSFEESGKASEEFAGSAGLTNEELAELRQRQADVAEAIDRNTLAVRRNRDSWMENFNTLAEFSGHMTRAGVAVAGTTIAMGKGAAAAAGITTRQEGAAAAAKTLAARMLGIGLPVLGATVAFKSYRGVLNNTGKEVVAVNKAHQDLADSINRGQKTIEEVQKETGKSLAELGLVVETNLTRSQKASGEAKRLIVGDMKEIGKAALELTGVPEAYRQTVEFVDKETTRFTDNYVENMDLVVRAADKAMGRNTELRREQERLAELAEKQEPLRRRARAMEEAIGREAELTRELANIREIATKEDLQNRLTAEKQKRGELIRTLQFEGAAEQAHYARLRALLKQEQTLRQQAAQRHKEIAKSQADFAVAMEERRLKKLQEQSQEEAAIREEAAERRRLIEEARREGRNSLITQERLALLERVKQRAKIEGRGQELILEAEKEAAKVRAAEDMANAKTEEEAVRIRFALQRELRELDLRHDLEIKQKKADAAKAAARKELDAEREKIERIKGIRDEQGQNAFQSIAARQSRQDILKELARKRETSVKQVMQQGRAGQISEAEVARVQSDLAARQILAARKAGKVSENTVKALAEQARENSEQIRFNEEMSRQLAEVQAVQREQAQTTKGQAQRLQAQRRGNRR